MIIPNLRGLYNPGTSHEANSQTSLKLQPFSTEALTIGTRLFPAWDGKTWGPLSQAPVKLIGRNEQWQNHQFWGPSRWCRHGGALITFFQESKSHLYWCGKLSTPESWFIQNYGSNHLLIHSILTYFDHCSNQSNSGPSKIGIPTTGQTLPMPWRTFTWPLPSGSKMQSIRFWWRSSSLGAMLARVIHIHGDGSQELEGLVMENPIYI